MARASGHAPSTIHRIWRAFGLQPHRSETFKLSSDPFFVEKVRGHRRSVFGAAGSCRLVLCVDEKMPDPGPGPFPAPLADAPRSRRSGAAGDYKLHGTTSLFEEALDIATGEIIGKCFPRHRAREFRKFLDLVEANVPGDLDIRHRHGQLRDPQDQGDPRLVRQTAALAGPFHTTPASSWLNQVERWFGSADRNKQIRRKRPSLHEAQLERTILDYIDTTNQNPKWHWDKWTKSADDILGAIQRFCLRTIEIAEQQAKMACELRNRDTSATQGILSDVNAFAGGSGRADSRGGEIADPVVGFYGRLSVLGHVNGRWLTRGA